MIQPLKGTIHGKTIELADDTGLPNGQQVAVIVHPIGGVASRTDSAALESLRRAAGAWAGDDEMGLERYLEWNRQQRKLGGRNLGE